MSKEAIKWFVRAMAVLGVTVGWLGSASAQQGTGNACTSGWPTNYQCEEFFWDGSTSSRTLWDTSQGYCYLNSAALGADGTAHMEVVASGGNWTLQGGPTQRDLWHWGSAICVTYPWYQSYLQGSYTGGNSTTNSSMLTTNQNFCSLAGLQYSPVRGNGTSFATAGYEYPSGPTSTNLLVSVQNATSAADIAYGQCLVAPGSFWLYWGDGYWWGNGSYADASGNQDVFTYSTGPGYLYTGAPAYSTNCMITQIYPVDGKSFWVDVEVEDETGNWYVYADSGVLSVQVACINNAH